MVSIGRLNQYNCQQYLLAATATFQVRGDFGTQNRVKLGNHALLLVAQWFERWCASLVAQVRILAVSFRVS